MEEAEARRRFASSRVARLGTVRPDGSPHLVPFVFAVDGDRIYFAVDDKPKRSARLARLEHIAGEPRVSAIVDRYEDDWSALWWVRADGAARIVDDPAEAGRALDLLAGRYLEYRDRRPTGPVVAVDVARWASWSAS
ncbi:MAG: TIGR03668 family PPOX class F420-dependent oxidoreductase [Actinobacteria bacterium]|nr:TIGR03668 family PPOX class F420-dependent oxidoreductase [Actinomycetota bacterium]